MVTGRSSLSACYAVVQINTSSSTGSMGGTQASPLFITIAVVITCWLGELLGTWTLDVWMMMVVVPMQAPWCQGLVAAGTAGNRA